ncbi:MAG: hypothetical protein KDC82_01530 [Bacteroidetes bacterium]|nr:hypothetical protein [Bacteroidota bacterium]
MKEQIKDSFKESFQHKAPSEFTDKLMSRLAKEEQTQPTLIPKAYLFFIVAGFVLAILLVLFSTKNTATVAVATSQFLELMFKIMPGLILPLCIAALFFLQQLFHYRKI